MSAAAPRPRWPARLRRALALVALSALALQLWFALRIAAMAWLDPASSAMQRSEAWRVAAVESRALAWRQRSVDDGALPDALRRAVVAAEDSGFAEHRGVEWDALRTAWQRNFHRLAARGDGVAAAAAQAAGLGAGTGDAGTRLSPRLHGGSTITQQLAKNLFLSGERNAARKAQEFVVAMLLEALLDKRRILTIYLNSVEWGEGVFGAQAAAQRHFRVDAARLTPAQAARLAAMLPAPKRHERRPGAAALAARSATILARMGDVTLP